jgi:uncharacterized membrane protein
MKITRKRTLVKTICYRIWIFTVTYIFLIVTGKHWRAAIVPTITLNFLMSFTYYSYDRLWQKIKWGIEK